VELPKLSQFTKVLAAPEEYFEGLVKSTLGVEVPPGIQSIILRLQTSIESGEGLAPEKFIRGIPLPRLSLPKLEEVLAKFPELPELPAIKAPAVEVKEAPAARVEKPKTF